MRFVVKTQDESWEDISEKEMIKLTTELEKDDIEFEVAEYEEEEVYDNEDWAEFVSQQYYRDRI